MGCKEREDTKTGESQREKSLTIKGRLSVVPYGPEDRDDRGFELDWQHCTTDFRYKLVEDIFTLLGVGQTMSPTHQGGVENTAPGQQGSEAETWYAG